MNWNQKSALSVLMGTTALAVSGVALAQDTGPEIADEIVVRGINIPDEKRATSEISAVIDRESFVRTGDSDIAGALARVAGLSISEGKFVIVRGLNERYSSVTLDGSPLPSPEPLQRVVPLDLIPTSFLEGSLVQKTYSPQYSAEFGGGLVELRTRSIPDENYFSLSLSTGINTVTNAQDGLTYDGGDLDWLGFDDGTRSIPPLLENAFFGQNGLNFNAADQNAIDLQLDPARTSVIFEEVLPVNWGVGIAAGGFRETGNDIVLGANLALNLSNDYFTREGRREQGLTGQTNQNADAQPFAVPADGIPSITARLFDFTSTTQTATLNGLLSLGAEIGSDHELKSTTYILRSTIKDARQQDGIIAEEEDREFLRENIEFFERQVWQTQLSGEHIFPSLNELSVNWRGAFGKALRDAPYQRDVLRGRVNPNDTFALIEADGQFGSLGVGSLGLTFSDIRDQNIDAGIDFVLPLTVADYGVDVKFGYAYTDKERDTLVRDFTYVIGGLELPDQVRTARNDVVFSPGVVGTDALDIRPFFNPISLDNAFSTLQVHAGYFGLDAELGEYIRVAAGVRYERSEQITSAFSTPLPAQTLTTVSVQEDQIQPGDPVPNSGNTEYFLPNATITWNPVGDLQLRAGYSQTITRPQFRELTPATFLEDDTDQLTIGNPFLVNAEIDNFDLRAEYYLGRGQFITVGGFYKDITNPIERAQTQIGGESSVTFINAPSAELYGVEFEYEQTFALEDLMPNAGYFSGKDFLIKTNYTYSQSEVSADGNVVTALVDSQFGASPRIVPAAGFVEEGRSLQGQSDHLFNLQLGLENPETNGKATLLVNWSSERIRQVRDEITGAPSVFERPPLLLDFVWSRDVEIAGQNFNINFAARNILGDEYEAIQKDEDFANPVGRNVLFDVYELGRELSVGLKYNF